MVSIMSSSPDSELGRAEADAAMRQKTLCHPCYDEDAGHFYSRLHIAVAPADNLGAHWRPNRAEADDELLTAEQALARVRAVAAVTPQLGVVGVQGPGDPLANPEPCLRSFALIRAALPELQLCLSTNGLTVADHVDALVGLGVGHVTLTINALDPEIAARIHPWVDLDRRRHVGTTGARLLISRQLLGLDRLVAAGIVVKVNTLLIPGINDEHVVEINRELRHRGAAAHAILPVVRQPGDRAAGVRAPSAAELEAAQSACAGGLKVLRHCRCSRLDAPADLAGTTDPTAAGDYHARVEIERARRQDRRSAARAGHIEDIGQAPLRVAAATTGDYRVNGHFGSTTEFLIYEVDAAGARLVGVRRVPAYAAATPSGIEAMAPIVAALQGCRAVLVARIGERPGRVLLMNGIEAVDRFAGWDIEEAALACFGEAVRRRNAGFPENPYTVMPAVATGNSAVAALVR